MLHIFSDYIDLNLFDLFTYTSFWTWNPRAYYFAERWRIRKYKTKENTVNYFLVVSNRNLEYATISGYVTIRKIERLLGRNNPGILDVFGSR